MSVFCYLDENKIAHTCDAETYVENIKIGADRAAYRIKQDVINGRLVNTIFLGINYSDSDDDPLIFETMIFENEDVGYEIYCNRYSTWEEAEIGHKKAVDLVLNGEFDNKE